MAAKKAKKTIQEVKEVNEEHENKLRSLQDTPVAPVEEPAEATPAVEDDLPMVKIETADNRTLEVSIGDQYWKGKEIFVPVELEDDVRRILIGGGFFLK